VSSEAIQRFIGEHGFKNYFRTSARTGLGVANLRDAILNSIEWDDLPSVSSTALFQEVQQLILNLQTERVHVLLTQEAYERLLRLVPAHRPTIGEFRTCAALLESRGLVRRLSFNDSMLFSPEYLDAYASAIVNQARVDPNGLGSVKEDKILKGHFLMNKSERMVDPALEKDVIIATLEDIILRQLAFREVTADGAIIVFPSQFTRENPDLPAPDGIELRIRFTGPLQNIYSTTTVRLFYADRFNVTEIWKNGVVVRDTDNRRAGFQISDFADGQGEIALFFERGVAVEFKRDFIDFVQQHIFELAAAGSIRTRKVFRCRSCATEFTDAQIRGRKSRGFDSISCSVCGADNPLSLIEESARVSAPTRNTAVAIASAQEAAEREANVAVGSAMVQSLDIRRWLGEGAGEAHVVIVFTDIVSSTKANNDLGDLAMDEIKEAHFATLSRNAAHYKGRILKNTGDGVLAIFRTTPPAVQFALSSARAPGHDEVRIRAGIHVGRVKPKDNDIFGQTVNFAARVQSSLLDTGVILSDDAKRDLERIHGKKQEFFGFKIRDGQELKGFDGKYTLWLIDRVSEGYLESVR
jgi:class 3 adenylate cyclase